jgi:uncharacterized protein YcfJ
MKRLNVVLLTGTLALICMPVWAGNKHGGYDKAKVVHAVPVYETVRFPVNEQVCWDEQVWQRRRTSAVPVIVGAVIGGVVGHELSHGNAQPVATVAGAAIGGTVGYQVARNGRYPVVQTRCEVQRNWRTEQRIVAWDVTYKYRGTRYTTRTLEQPGKHIMVQVNAIPASYRHGG